MRKLTAHTLVASHLLWGWGCTAHNTVRQPSGTYVAEPPSPSEPVRVRGVLTKSGEKTEYEGEHLAFLIGDRVVVYDEDARLLTAERTAARVTREGKEILSIRIADVTYDDVDLVMETPQSISFVIGGAPERQLPLQEIEELWVEKEVEGPATKAVVYTLLAVGALTLAVILYYAIGGPP